MLFSSENNRIKKTSNLFKKIGDSKGTFQARMGMIKDRNCKNRMEAKEIKRQEYTELYKKGLNDPVDYDDVVTHLEPDILQHDVKWA